ncbi:acyl-phosphate glycerol 3-phosphate acyltransferase [Paramagnetospirillum marisnigri]|uniref:Acyl-phosphate glycerol 3-phosphate acyltransferase n=1 Tax=Paramagnetospirillum marisnigri TaxID=1285242 RepID=A0A178MW03_9PROT|nr:lysophospholipid acyltransferase family protein [Paramagnetospirillum marisnigri]OAN54606.1 acyl-phosphate glycerol 3-phosphate acyltransferase [Paramagnetospirillum marisnigri]
MISPLLGGLRFSAFVVWTLLALVPFLVIRPIRRDLAASYVRGYWKVVTRLIGYTVISRGAPLEGQGPVLFIPNHSSYLDIIVLGSLLKAFFVAKAEVSGWPGFGFLARISRTVFIERRPGATARERDNVRTRLDAGDSLVLFAEGTSNDGNRVLPFKSSFLAVAEGEVTPPGGQPRPVMVQPVSIAYTRLDGFPMSRALRPFVAWYGDMTLAPHLIGALGLGRITVEVEFHAPVTLAELGSRKELAIHCHKTVAHGVTRLLAGR